MAESETDMIRRCATQWLRDNESRARVLIRSNPSMTIAELKTATGWSDYQVNNMTTYLSMVEPA